MTRRVYTSELFIREKDGKKAGRVCLAGNGRDSRLIDRAPYFRRYKRWVDGTAQPSHTETGPALAEYMRKLHIQCTSVRTRIRTTSNKSRHTFHADFLPPPLCTVVSL